MSGFSLLKSTVGFVQHTTRGLLSGSVGLSSHLSITRSPILTQCRNASQLAPRKTKYRKAQKGRIPVRTGGSTKGNYIAFGDYALRVKDGVRLSANQITAATNTIRKKIKPLKGSQIWCRVFPDIPVSSKGNETRMGKGKGAFEYWACRVPRGKILFEIGGGGMREEIAKEALRLGADKLPVKVEFVVRTKEVVETPAVVEEATPANL
ncbi:hypothetical protein K493DRAFT_322092 [Basidiobolus meristosporus CBS 931.73]|uniref:Uncharacterized protein n=1 Tax=Basidiobolus meristosporus CBS 931.73 TaxID=1314790 RepID=A0A1Y1VQV1_9FUNG|nr:hypothetical protein K493DRAFT_322092 [Basidiobolus meristosporus CBS 931.73]|eukprot:ORX63658.1 hypothetical protein K493DRAFT_322092 [Basidiobolus meristosporus CBS 931.73]